MQVHPDTPRCFVFRGQPFRILASAEHYGAVLNAAFDWRVYLDEMARSGENATRVFTFYREEQHPGIPGVADANTLAPAPVDAVLPWSGWRAAAQPPMGWTSSTWSAGTRPTSAA